MLPVGTKGEAGGVITPDAVRLALNRYQSARPAMKGAMRDSATALALQISIERDALVSRMEKRWSWCDGNEGHDQFIDREDALIADIRQYEAIEDVLREAATALLDAA